MRKRTTICLLVLVFLPLSFSIEDKLEGTAKIPVFTGVQPPDALDDLIAKANEREYWHPALRDIQSVQIVVQEKYSDWVGLSPRLASIASYHLPIGLEKIVSNDIKGDATLTVQVTCRALSKDYPEGLLYTGALVEGKIVLEAKGFKMEENFRGEIEPPLVLPQEITANPAPYKDPKNAPYYKALLELPGSYVDKLARIYYKAFGIYALSSMVAVGDPVSGIYYQALDPLVQEIGEPLLEPFLHLLKSKLEAPPLISAHILTLIKSPKAIPALVYASAKRWWDNREFDETLKTLGKEPGGVKELLSCLKDKEASVRAKSAEILGFVGGDKAVEGLISALKDKDLNVRRKTARSLFLLKDKKSLLALIKVLENPQEDEEVTVWAIRALGEIRDPRAIEPLQKIAQRGGQLYELSQEAQKALQNIPPPPLPLPQAISNWRIAVERKAELDIERWEIELIKNGKSAVEHLLPIAENPSADKELRISALRVLSEIKDDRPYHLYLKIAKDEKESLATRFYAIRGLGNCFAREASDFLIYILTRRNEPEVLRCASAYALGEKRETRAIEPLYFAFKSASTSYGRYPWGKYYDPQIKYWSPLREEAANALVKIGEPALERIKDAFNDENLAKRLAILHALSKSEEKWAQELLFSALKDPSLEVRLWVAEYFIYKKEKNRTVMDTLISILEDKESSPYEKKKAVSLIADLFYLSREQGARKGLVEALKNYLKSVRLEEDESIRYALDILGYLKDASSAEVIRPFLRSSEKYIKETAIEALAKIGKANGALDDLIYITKNDPVAGIRRKAVEALGKLKDQRGLNAIIDALKYDQEDTVRIGAVEALRNWKPQEAVKPLASYLPQCKDTLRKKDIAEILAKTNRAKAASFIIPLLKDKKPNVRASAAEALGLLEAWEGVEALIELLTDEDAKVRDNALKALEAIAHNSYGYNLGMWQAWWEGKKEELIKRGELK